MQAPPKLEPVRLKVFGVLQIVFGSLWILWFLVGSIVLLGFSLGMDALMSLPMEQLEGAERAQAKGILDSLEAFLSDLFLTWWVFLIGAGIVGVLMLVAGIQLCQKKRRCLSKHNAYVWTEVGYRVIYLVLFFSLVIPAINTLEESVAGVIGVDPLTSPEIQMMQNMAQAAGTVIFELLLLIYPILSYCMLNKPLVRNYLAEHGK